MATGQGMSRHNAACLRRLSDGCLRDGGVSDLMNNRSFLGGPGRPRNPLKRWGAVPNIFSKGFWAARGRPEPQNDRVSIKSLNHHPLNHHRAAFEFLRVFTASPGNVRDNRNCQGSTARRVKYTN